MATAQLDLMNRVHRILGLIPARGGSKGLPGKNLRMLGGKPLLAWTIEAARAVASIDRVIVSTDCPDIGATARQWGAETPFTRPGFLAADTTGSVEVVRHALDALGEVWDYVVLLQPTSPLRTGRDIEECIRRCVDVGAPSCVSVAALEKPLSWLFAQDEVGHLIPQFGDEVVPRRQDERPLVFPNGAIYVFKPELVKTCGRILVHGTIGYEMSPECSVDIDTALDLKLCELLLDEAEK